MKRCWKVWVKNKPNLWRTFSLLATSLRMIWLSRKSLRLLKKLRRRRRSKKYRSSCNLRKLRLKWKKFQRLHGRWKNKEGQLRLANNLQPRPKLRTRKPTKMRKKLKKRVKKKWRWLIKNKMKNLRRERQRTSKNKKTMFVLIWKGHTKIDLWAPWMPIWDSTVKTEDWDRNIKFPANSHCKTEKSTILTFRPFPKPWLWPSS